VPLAAGRRGGRPGTRAGRRLRARRPLAPAAGVRGLPRADRRGGATGARSRRPCRLALKSQLTIADPRSILRRNAPPPARSSPCASPPPWLRAFRARHPPAGIISSLAVQPRRRERGGRSSQGTVTLAFPDPAATQVLVFSSDTAAATVARDRRSWPAGRRRRRRSDRDERRPPPPEIVVITAWGRQPRRARRNLSVNARGRRPAPER